MVDVRNLKISLHYSALVAMMGKGRFGSAAGLERKKLSRFLREWIKKGMLYRRSREDNKYKNNIK